MHIGMGNQSYVLPNIKTSCYFGYIKMNLYCGWTLSTSSSAILFENLKPRFNDMRLQDCSFVCLFLKLFARDFWLELKEYQHWSYIGLLRKRSGSLFFADIHLVVR